MIQVSGLIRGRDGRNNAYAATNQLCRVWRQSCTENHHPHQPWGQELYRFEHVPALVCTQCAHVWLEAKVSQAIDEIIRKHPKPTKYEQVPVFSLADELHKA